MHWKQPSETETLNIDQAAYINQGNDEKDQIARAMLETPPPM